MKTKRTDKIKLAEGVKFLGLTVVFMFAGPSLIYVAFSNQEKVLFIPILIVALLLCFAAVFFGIKGLKTIVSSVFDG